MGEGTFLEKGPLPHTPSSLPPKTFDLEVTDRDDKFIRDTNLTGTAFFEKYVGLNLDDYVSLINAPTADKPYHRSYSVKFLGNVKEGCPVRYLNLPIEELKKSSNRTDEGRFSCMVWL